MTAWLKLRVGTLFLCFFLFCALIGFRLVQLQVMDNPDLQKLAKRQFEQRGKKNPARISLLDRNGEELAVSMPSHSIFARPKLIVARKDTARKLARLLGGTPQKWLARMQADKSFVWIQRQVDENLARKIDGLAMTGIFVEPENRRIYPNEQLASNVVGFTDIDGKGISGLEMTLNADLSREKSRFSAIRDGKGNLSYIDSKGIKAREENYGIRTTIDRRIQFALEEELDAAQAHLGSKAVLAIVMDPHTGEIFAMGQRPSFDPNDDDKSAMERTLNRAVSFLYEPGSVFKTFFAAKAIQDKVMTPQTPVDCGQGEITIGNKKIREAETDHKYGRIPLQKVIQYSSNVGAIRVGQALGAEKMQKALEQFGFFAKTGIQLPGEVAAAAKPASYWTPFNQASIAFGQAISVNALQLVSAYAPFANGGYRVHPTLVPDAIQTPRASDRILDEKTAKQMREILVTVTEGEHGTGNLARISGVSVAGKTGTAQKYDPKGGYEAKKYFASFVGFLPAEKPELLIGVMVDEPKYPYYASMTAAPLFRRVAERSLQILDRGPRKFVAATAKPETKRVAELVLRKADGDQFIMPDLKGITLRESLRLLSPHFSDVQFEGTGYLTSQIPAAGTHLSPSAPIQLSFSPEG